MKTGTASFRQLFEGGGRVEIPTIQRDYAQGRTDERSEDVRARFIASLTSALTNGAGATLDLDFVYGRFREKDKVLEPLDGQQRLTTLFLLHWYVANVDGAAGDFRSWATTAEGGSRFSYRTRPSAREFFDELARHEMPAEAFGTTKVSEWALDSVWFVRGWLRDPTVYGCLIMLDAIQEKLADAKGLWPRLISTDSPVIVFQLLLLENFGLSDDLYVKMNARGKPLTPFEVFKAELEVYIAEVLVNERCTAESTSGWREYVGRQFDTAWTDFLWRLRVESHEIDAAFMHLIRGIMLIGSVDDGDDADLPTRIDRLGSTPARGRLLVWSSSRTPKPHSWR
jgi:hypothetical protein